MIGGGSGAFIGAVHRLAIQLDGEARVVAGALSSTPERALESGRELGLAADRTYPDWRAMLTSERQRPDPIDAVVIVTPNHAHFEPALAALNAGFHVIIDKPMVVEPAHASALQEAATRAGRILAVTYNYTGYPLVRTARELIRTGELGPIRKVIAEYHQGWLATNLASEGQKQAAWRGDPVLAGAGALGDIGTHAENLIRYVSGLHIESLAADVHTLVHGRRVDDDALVRLRFAGGAVGHISVSQVCVGEENGLALRIYGENAGLTWRQEHPNELHLNTLSGDRRIITRGSTASQAQGLGATRLPPGHPEGFIEAFANVYRGVFAAMRGERGAEYPDVNAGAAGVRFVAAALSSRGAWVPLR
ncbi:MAG: gfo/Idh/MocA family oxidoreductase [Tepidisphaera sp.]|nr:gfo/Idh/MocA family oxidoreductase [Tepidisphaera sp.]